MPLSRHHAHQPVAKDSKGVEGTDVHLAQHCALCVESTLGAARSDGECLLDKCAGDGERWAFAL